MQLAQRGDRAEVQVLAEHERPHDLLERRTLRGELRVAVANTGADTTRPLSQAKRSHSRPERHQVLLEHRVRHGQRPRIAVRSQAHVDAEHESIAGDVATAPR